MTFEEVLKQELDIAESWRKVAEGFERDNQRLRAELESDGKVRARLKEDLDGALRDNRSKCLELADKAQEIRKLLAIYDPLALGLRGCVVWHRLAGDTVRLLPIPAHIEAMRTVVQVKVFEDEGQAAPLVVTLDGSVPVLGGSVHHTGAPGNSSDSREDRDVPP